MASRKRKLKLLPYRDEAELIEIRGWFYSYQNSFRPDRRRDACEKVRVWLARGGLPLEVEATALLTEAILHDDLACSDEGSCISMETVRATYATALSRFVTLLADVKQDKRHKINMYDIGKGLGMPAGFVDIRHRITHYDLPALEELRENAPLALKWLRERYWDELDRPRISKSLSGRDVGERNEGTSREGRGPTRALDEFAEDGVRTFRSMKAILDAADAHIATFESDRTGADGLTSGATGDLEKAQEIDLDAVLRELPRSTSVWIPTPLGTIIR